jgi:hypothetical protein
MGKSVADQWVRLGMAIVIIALISLCLYQFSGRASAVVSTVGGIAQRPYRPAIGSRSPRAHDPEKWEPVFGKDRAQ